MTEIRTPEQIRAQGTITLDLLRFFAYTDEIVIDNYPLGRSDRGKCRLAVEHRKGYGYRLVRTTENPGTGGWFKPHKGQYQSGLIIPARDLCRELQRLHPEFVGNVTFEGWVQLSEYGVYLRRADYSTLTLLESVNRSYAPRREPKQMGDTLLQADSPELIAAYDAYIPVLQEILDFFKAVKADMRQRAECAANV